MIRANISSSQLLKPQKDLTPNPLLCVTCQSICALYATVRILRSGFQHVVCLDSWRDPWEDTWLFFKSPMPQVSKVLMSIPLDSRILQGQEYVFSFSTVARREPRHYTSPNGWNCSCPISTVQKQTVRELMYYDYC